MTEHDANPKEPGEDGPSEPVTGSGVATPGGTTLRHVARQTGAVLVATFAVQIVTFAVLAVSGAVLPTAIFAQLAIIVAATMLSATVWDFGISITIIKKYGETGSEAYLRRGFAVRIALLPLACLIGAVLAYGLDKPGIGLGVVLGAVMNFWNGLRSTDQCLQDYRSFVRSSIMFSALRAVAGTAAILLMPNPYLIAVALYALPVLAGPFSRSFRFVLEAFRPGRVQLREFLWYTTHVYLNAVAFTAIPYVPQFLIDHRLTDADVGTYGLILTFTSPISLIVYSVRSVLLPRMVGKGSDVENALWSPKGLGGIALIWTGLMLGGVLVSYGLDYVYAAKYPQVQQVFLIFFAAFSATALFGLLSLSVHTQGVPHLNMIISVVKLLMLVPVLLAYGTTLPQIVAMTAFTMVAGELALIIVLALGRRRRQPTPLA